MYEAIDALQESTAWHILVGDEVLSIIKDNFDLLKEYRNDVMHAHNISWEKIKKQKSYLLMQMMHLRWNSISYCNIPQLRSCLKRRHPPSMKNDGFQYWCREDRHQYGIGSRSICQDSRDFCSKRIVGKS